MYSFIFIYFELFFSVDRNVNLVALINMVDIRTRTLSETVRLSRARFKRLSISSDRRGSRIWYKPVERNNLQEHNERHTKKEYG